jgi:hypothetical protein
LYNPKAILGVIFLGKVIDNFKATGVIGYLLIRRGGQGFNSPPLGAFKIFCLIPRRLRRGCSLKRNGFVIEIQIVFKCPLFVNFFPLANKYNHHKQHVPAWLVL